MNASPRWWQPAAATRASVATGATSAPPSNGRLESVLCAGKPAVTAETTSPDPADAQAVRGRAGCLGDEADAVNTADGAGAKGAGDVREISS